MEGLLLKTTDEWLIIFEKMDVPAQRYNTIEELLEDPHLEEVGFFKQETHLTEGLIRKTKVANSFSGGERQNSLDAPRLGGDTKSILMEIGYSESEIENMFKTGAANSPQVSK